MTDLPPIIPASVNVVFPSVAQVSPDPPEYVTTVTLASLGLSQFDSTLSVNANAVYVLQRAEQAVWSAHTVTNSAVLTTLAQQAATDWYLQQLSKIDMSFAGLEAWTPEGTSDYVEWTHGLGTDGLPMVSTRVQRGAFYTYLENLNPPIPPGSTITVTDGTVTYVTNIIQFPGGTVTQPGGPGTTVIYTPDLDHDVNRWKQSTEWYTANNTGLLTGGFTISPFYLYAIPVICTGKRTLSGIGFYLESVGTAGAKAAIALYDVANDASILPRNPIPSASFINIPVDVGATSFISLGATGSVGPGLYWLVFCSDNAPGLLAVQGILTVLPTIGSPPQQVTWLRQLTPTGDPTAAFNNNPFTLATDGANGAGPYLAWKM